MPYDAEHQTLATRPVWLAKRGPRARPRRRAKSCRVAGGNDDDDARASTAPKLNQLTCPGCQGGCPGNWPDTASAPFSRWHQHERVVQRAVRQTCLFVGAAGSCLRSRCHNMVSLPMRPACDALPVCDADAEEERPSSSACNSTLAKRKASAGERRAFAEDASSPMSRTSASAGATSTGRRALSGMYLLSTFWYNTCSWPVCLANNASTSPDASMDGLCRRWMPLMRSRKSPESPWAGCPA